VVEAHQTPLSCVALNNEGTLLATASEKGTIIRVFSLPDAQKLFQFRRGSIPARIYSMSFNSTSTLLCVSSATETVHIFRLSAQKEGGRRGSTTSTGLPSPTADRSMGGFPRDPSGSPSSEEVRGDTSEYGAGSESPTGDRKPLNPTLASMIRRTSQSVGKSFVSTVGGYLPKAVGEMWEPARDFAWVRLPKQGFNSTGPTRSVVALSNNGPQVMVVTNEGNYFVYNVDLERGGEGTLVKQYSYVDILIMPVQPRNPVY
jgi:autophagy-related protein 18